MTPFKSDLKDRCFRFSLNIISLCDSLPNKRNAWVIADQITRSGTSIGANVVEAKSSSSRLEFKRFYEIALKSANETAYWLELLKASQLAKPELIDSLLQEVDELCRIIASSVLKLKSRNL